MRSCSGKIPISFEDSALSRERDGASSVKKPDGMAILDESRGGYRVFVGDLGSRVGKYELEREFQHFGPILDVWVARCVFLEFPS